MSDPLAALRASKANAYDLSTSIGRKRTLDILERAQRELVTRLHQSELLRGGDKTFTYQQMKVTLAQLRGVTRNLGHGLERVVRSQARDATDASVGHTLDYLNRAEKKYRGIASEPLPIRELAMLNRVAVGVNASVLRRLGTSGGAAPGAMPEEHPAKEGILERYGEETIGHFEDSLTQGLAQRKRWGDIREDLVGQSPFLQAAPAHWAERIVRTETMGAYNRAGWETIREAHEDLGDMCKILVATFDDRTSADSYAVHGQIRRADQAFETWQGFLQHPPARPNDREIVAPHRVSWVIPPGFSWKTDADVAKRWIREGRKHAPPVRPKMTTIPIESFGRNSQTRAK